ncbi:MAG: FkbM family methyltransferase [Prochlorococcaceae cyanobacterium]
MTLAAFWDGDWQAVCTQHDVGSTDPAAWLRLAMAQRLLGRPADAARAASLALGATPDDTRAALRTATQLLLAQALLLSAMDDAALVLIERALPAWLEPCQRAPRARLLACRLLLQVGAWKLAEALHGRGVLALPTEVDAAGAAAELAILRTETELLSHELALALDHGSLTAPQAASDHDRWRSLSRSQLGQDLWVLERSGWQRGGFFVEFGATNGVLLSNTWLLEKHFDWQGICCEPNPGFLAQLRQNRHCTVTADCIYARSGETMAFVLADAYGGLSHHGNDDQHVDKRAAYAAAGHVINVVTTSLVDLLDRHGAPPVIDYLSIDTEGSELAILDAFDWSRYTIRFITVEHNHTAQRQPIHDLLTGLGYRRTEAQWDDWYEMQ